MESWAQNLHLGGHRVSVPVVEIWVSEPWFFRHLEGTCEIALLFPHLDSEQTEN